jgi:hypothetical protein
MTMEIIIKAECPLIIACEVRLSFLGLCAMTISKKGGIMSKRLLKDARIFADFSDWRLE